MIEHEQPDGRREITLLPIGVDRGDQIGQGHIAVVGDFLEALPERIFETDARLVAPDNDGSLDHRIFLDVCGRQIT